MNLLFYELLDLNMIISTCVLKMMSVISSRSDSSCCDRSWVRPTSTIIDHLISCSCRMSSRQVLRIFMMILLMIRLILIQVLIRSYDRRHFSRSRCSCSCRCAVWRCAGCWCCSCCCTICRRGRGWLARWWRGRWRRRWRGWVIHATIHVDKTWDIIDGSHHVDHLRLSTWKGRNSELLAMNMMLMMILKTRTQIRIFFVIYFFGKIWTW